MSKEQALSILVELAYRADIPKGLTGSEAVKYLNQIEEARKVLESTMKVKK